MSDEQENTDEEARIQKEQRRTYLENYKDKTTDIFNKSYEHFERQLSYISAGALGLSFILIEKVLKNIYASSNKGFLVAGWIFLGLTLLINLISHKYAIECHYKTIKEINVELKGDGTFSGDNATNRRKKIESINIVSMVLLFLGIGLILLYTSINLLK